MQVHLCKNARHSIRRDVGVVFVVCNALKRIGLSSKRLRAIRPQRIVSFDVFVACKRCYKLLPIHIGSPLNLRQQIVFKFALKNLVNRVHMIGSVLAASGHILEWRHCDAADCSVAFGRKRRNGESESHSENKR